ncbi:hypothetical protein [Clostridium tunisiense]|uniref:hypothetical protein n=1 Tax=Clostridium tunisiense TaxID=219748 RepID=UPI0003006067|nr:hypothetical protein [Clostridium tunisiense]
MKIKNGNKFKINISEILFFISFTVLVGATIYFISKGLNSTDIKMEVTNTYSVDQANAIKAMADSTVGRINNTVAVSAIFFTIVVTSISVFQYMKTKDIDKIKEELIKEMDKNHRLIRLKTNKSSKKLDEIETEYSEKFKILQKDYTRKNNEINNMMRELEGKIRTLDLKSIELDIDTTYIKIRELKGRNQIPVTDVINSYEKIKSLCEEHTNIKSEEFLSEIYRGYAEYRLLSIGNLCDYDYVKNMLEKSIELTDSPINEDFSYRILLMLEKTFHNNLENEIYYLKKIVEDSYYDLDICLELAVALDRRNNEGDLDECIELLKTNIRIHGIKAKVEIVKKANDNQFRNLKNSNLAEEAHKILNIDNE